MTEPPVKPPISLPLASHTGGTASHVGSAASREKECCNSKLQGYGKNGKTLSGYRPLDPTFLGGSRLNQKNASRASREPDAGGLASQGMMHLWCPAEIAERAAMIEEGDGCDRATAERMALGEAGFPSWLALATANARHVPGSPGTRTTSMKRGKSCRPYGTQSNYARRTICPSTGYSATTRAIYRIGSLTLLRLSAPLALD